MVAGKDVSHSVKLRQLVGKATGGREKPAASKEPVHANADGEVLRTDPPGSLVSSGTPPLPLAAGAQLFSDREYLAAEIPAQLKGASFLPVAMSGQKTLKCERPGTVFFLTPLLKRNRDTVARPWKDQGFEKVALPEVSLFNAGAASNYCTLFQKDCAAGETILIGKWAVPVFFTQSTYCNRAAPPTGRLTQ